MLNILARIVAKRKYVWAELLKAATNDLNAGLSARLSAEKRTIVAQMNKEADAIEQRIKEVAELEEKGYWECENGHEWSEQPRLRPVEDRPANLCVERVNGKECGGEVDLIRRSQMTGQQKYESDQQRKEAEKIVADKRAQAQSESENADQSEKTAQYFRGQASNGRQLAEKIRSL